MAETYTLRLLVDDSAVRRLESRMNRIMSMRDPSGGGGGSQKKGLGGFIEGMMGMKTEQKQSRFGMFKAVGKLALISGGVAAILLIAKKLLEGIVESSPMLQGMLKILHTATQFMLRPIGDFLGYFLRPLVIFFLRNVAVPFYREWGPKAREWGTAFGSIFLAIMTFLKNPLDIFKGPAPHDPGDPTELGYPKEYDWGRWDRLANDIQTAWESLIGGAKPLPPAYGDTGEPTIEQDWWEGLVEQFSQGWLGMTDWLQTNVWEPLQYVWGEIVNWFGTNIYGPLVEILAPIWEALTTWFSEQVMVPLEETLVPIWDTFVGFWKGLGVSFEKVITPAWIQFAMLWSSIGEVFEKVIWNAWSSMTAWFEKIGTEVNVRLTPLWNTLVDVWQRIVNGFIAIWNKILSIAHALGLFKQYKSLDSVDFSESKVSPRSTISVVSGGELEASDDDTIADVKAEAQAQGLMEVAN